jgi:hypothetical protein
MKLPFTIPKMKLSKLERFLRGVCRVYTIPDKHPCVYGGCGFVSAEYVGHVFWLRCICLYVSPILGVLYILWCTNWSAAVRL